MSLSAPEFSRQNCWNAAISHGMSSPSSFTHGVSETRESISSCSSRVKYLPMISAYIGRSKGSDPVPFQVASHLQADSIKSVETFRQHLVSAES